MITLLYYNIYMLTSRRVGGSYYSLKLSLAMEGNLSCAMNSTELAGRVSPEGN